MVEAVLYPVLRHNLRPTAAAAVAPYPVLHHNLLPMEKAVVVPIPRHNLRPMAMAAVVPYPVLRGVEARVFAPYRRHPMGRAFVAPDPYRRSHIEVVVGAAYLAPYRRHRVVVRGHAGAARLEMHPDFFLLRGTGKGQSHAFDLLHLDLGLVTAPIFLRGQSQMQDRLGPQTVVHLEVVLVLFHDPGSPLFHLDLDLVPASLPVS